MSNYEDIIHLEHHTSSKHPRMSMYARAAQFASFNALTGKEEYHAEEQNQTGGTPNETFVKAK